MFEYTDYLSRKSIEPVRETDWNNVVVYRPENRRWYIRMGFAGFNTPANNRNGYNSAARALAVVRHYQSKRG